MSRPTLHSVVRWEQPPPSARPNISAGTLVLGCGEPWAEVVADLQLRPEQWAVVHETRSSYGAATGLASRIRRGSITGFEPAGTFEAVTRTVHGKHTVYARFVGGGDVG